MRQNSLLTLIFFLPILAVGQSNNIDLLKLEAEVMTYKRLFAYADSLTIRGNVGQISDDLLKSCETLDEGRPVDYFLSAVKMLDKGNYNDASFLYYLGDLRYKYYNSVNPKYAESEDGALLASFNYALGEPVGYYLRSNVDNFIQILKKCSEYYLANDYDFYPKKKDPTKYVEQAERLNKVIADLQLNKITYQDSWDKQQLEFEKNLDSAWEQLRKK